MGVMNPSSEFIFLCLRNISIVLTFGLTFRTDLQHIEKLFERVFLIHNH